MKKAGVPRTPLWRPPRRLRCTRSATTLEVGGPEVYRLNEFIEWGLTELEDRRKVVADSQSRYFGALLGERMLIPEPEAARGEVLFQDWLKEYSPKAHGVIVAGHSGRQS